MKLHSNHVLVRLTKRTDEVIIEGLGSLPIETVFDEERHQRLVGIIEEVPDELIFENLNHSQMPWECDMEAKVGDETIIRRTDVSVARHEGKSFERDGQVFVYVPYHSLILVKRKLTIQEININLNPTIVKNYSSIQFGQYMPDHHENMEKSQMISTDGEYFKVIMLNGYMLIEQDDKDLGSGLLMPDNVKNPKAETGTIKFIGKPNRRYHDSFDSKGNVASPNLPDNTFNLKVGDKIGFLKFASIDLEMELHQTFGNKGVKFGRLQRNKALCKL